jgi:hypothetical protein
MRFLRTSTGLLARAGLSGRWTAWAVGMPAAVTRSLFVPLDDPARVPEVRAVPERPVRRRHLPTYPVRGDRPDRDAQVGGDIGCAPPLGLGIGVNVAHVLNVRPT